MANNGRLNEVEFLGAFIGQIGKVSFTGFSALDLFTLERPGRKIAYLRAYRETGLTDGNKNIPHMHFCWTTEELPVPRDAKIHLLEEEVRPTWALRSLTPASFYLWLRRSKRALKYR